MRIKMQTDLQGSLKSRGFYNEDWVPNLIAARPLPSQAVWVLLTESLITAND